MNLRASLLLVGLSLCWMSAQSAHSADKPKSKPKDPGPQGAQRLQVGLVDYQAGKLAEAFTILQPLLEGSKPQQRAEWDQALATAGLKQTLADLVSSIRIELLPSQSKTQRLAPPGPVELPLALAKLAKQASSIQTRIHKELDVGFGQSMPHKVLDEKSTELQKLIRQAKPLTSLLEALEQMSKRIKPADLNKMDEPTQQLAARDFAGEKAEVATFEDQLLERLMEISVVRVSDMVEVLGNDKAKYTDRFRAATRINDSLAVLRANWDKYKRRKNRDPRVGPPGPMEAKWKAGERKYREISGQLAEKAYHFELGKEWWLRGRYGAGPLYNGLVKTTPQRVKNQELALLGYPLRMPDPIKPPADPLKDPRNNPPARRLFEIPRTVGQMSPMEQQLETYYSTSMDDKLTGLFAKETERAYRSIHQDAVKSKLVGYQEYQMALFHFETLLAATNEAEHKALDEMIADDPRFAVHSYISRQYDNLDPKSTLKLAVARTEDPRAKGQYERRGIAWAVALARLEIGAMDALREPNMANFDEIRVGQQIGNRGRVSTNTIASSRFAFDRDSRINNSGKILSRSTADLGQSAFLELLWDSARTLYYQVVTQTQAATRLPASTLPPATRTQLRADGADLSQMAVFYSKICLAVDFVTAFRQIADKSLTSVQKNELQEWLRVLEGARGRLCGAMQEYVAPQFGEAGWIGTQVNGGINQAPGNSGGNQTNKGNPNNSRGGMGGSTSPPTIRPPLGGIPGIPGKGGGQAAGS